MFLGAHATTIIVINKVAGSLPATTQQIIEAIEASPAGRTTLQLAQAELVLRFLIVPALVGGLYYGTRRRPFDSVKDKEFILGSMAMFFFLAALINVVNDLAHLAAFF